MGSKESASQVGLFVPSIKYVSIGFFQNQINHTLIGTLISAKGCKEVKYFLSRTLFKLFDFYLFYDLNGLNLKAINLFTP